MSATVRVGLGALCLLLCFGTDAAASKGQADSGGLSLDVLGFNDGKPYRLEGASAEAVVNDDTAVIFRLKGRNWMSRSGDGEYVKVTDVTARFPQRSPAELVSVYRFDLDADGTHELFLLPNNALIGDKHRYAPTLLKRKRSAYTPLWSASELPGERFQLLDVRDLNRDGKLEFVVIGEAGRAGFYRFRQIVGISRRAVMAHEVKHVDLLKFVDTDSDGVIELVIGERAGQRGRPETWTYVNRIHHWGPQGLQGVDVDYRAYHDAETLPTLVEGLIDCGDCRRSILDEKVAAIEQVVQLLLDHSKRPKGFKKRAVTALAALQKDQIDEAMEKLKAAQREYAYDPQVQLGLAEAFAHQENWDEVLNYALRALTVGPRQREAWWWAGSALLALEERSSALACLTLLVRLGDSEADGAAFLRARRGQPGMEGRLQRAIDQTLATLKLR